MKLKLQQIKLKLQRLFGFVPVKLPVGLAEFNKFYEHLISVYNLPDLPSYRQAVATMIMHLPPTISKKAPVFFAASIKKAMANQVAYDVIQAIRESEKTKDEATPAGSDSSNEPVSN
jgi:hypothetical protein